MNEQLNRIFKSRPWLMAILLLAAFGLGFSLRGSGGGNSGHDHADLVQASAAEPTLWTCSMHPQIILPSNDQKCPICAMDLIPLETGGGEGLGPRDLKLSETAAALAEITTAPVRREFVTRDIRLVGKVSSDETRTRTITARVAGRLDRLYVDATGQTVTRGMKLAEIYSPELYSAQAELQTAAKAARAAGNSGARAQAAQANLKSATERLRLWGMTDQQIQDITDGEGISENLTIRSPVAGVVVGRQATQGDYVKTGSILYTIADLDRVWVVLEAFESDLALLRSGQPVEFSTRAYPGRAFDGEILFIEPVLDERTRTVQVRVEVENIEGLLKPGMLVSGLVAVTVDVQGNPVVDPASAEPPLVIPASAPLLTGRRAVVYVRGPGEGDPVFTGREVVLGPRAGDDYLVFSGLSEGELVVTRGNFKIDSALQIQASPSMMNPGDSFQTDPCFGEGLAKVLDAYYPLQAALAADDDSAAKTAARRVAAALESLDCPTGDLPAAAVHNWSRLTAAMATGAAQAIAAEGIAQRRVAFGSLSDTLWDALAKFGHGPEGTVRRFHCPMAFDNKGANWIQAGETTANPYYGAGMLRCGSQEEVLKRPSRGATSTEGI
jgi:Cu(I)/Ag(I) efflux system membrane fusion protein